MKMTASTDWFTEARYGLFIHYGLYSLLERGEWVWNREEIPLEEYKQLAARFTAKDFDADRLCRMAVDAGMRYVVLTTMHHEGFRLYPTELSDFHIGNSGAAGRDLVAEIIAAARKHGLKVGLYHSLNNWYDQPDSVAALEDPVAYEKFISATHARIAEERGLPLVSLQKIFDDACRRAPAAYWAYDGIHPTHAGARLIADAWLQAAETHSLLR